MIGQRRFGVLGQALLLLGVIPLPPPREPEVDMQGALAAQGFPSVDVPYLLIPSGPVRAREASAEHRGAPGG